MCTGNRDYCVSNMNNKLLLDTKKRVSFNNQEGGLIYLATAAMANLIVALLEPITSP